MENLQLTMHEHRLQLQDQTTTTPHLLMDKHIVSYNKTTTLKGKFAQFITHEHRVQLLDQTTSTPHLLMDKHIYNLRTRLQN